MEDSRDNMAPRGRGTPVPVWVRTGEDNHPVVSFEPLASSTRVYTSMPTDIERLLELYSAAATAVRAAADVDNNREAVRILRSRLQVERKTRSGNNSPVVRSMQDDSHIPTPKPVDQEYPIESGRSVRALLAGHPDGNRRRH